jgi:hypothetical protein
LSSIVVAVLVHSEAFAASRKQLLGIGIEKLIHGGLLIVILHGHDDHWTLGR